MATSAFTTAWRAAVLLLMVMTAGCCCQAVPLPAEQQCPTDARRLYLGCGEEAVRRCPCGPDRAFYGHKPTEWRSWPEGWNCGHHGWDGEHGVACGDAIDCREMMGPADPISSAFEEPFGANIQAPEPTVPEAPVADTPLPPQVKTDTEGPFQDDPVELPLPETSPPPAETEPVSPESASPAPTTQPAPAEGASPAPAAQPAPAPPPIESLPMSNRVEQHVHQSLAF